MSPDEAQLKLMMAAWGRVNEECHKAESRRHNLELAIDALAEELRVEEIVSDGIKATRKTRKLWDQSLLAPLRELLDENEIEQCLTPQKPAPPRRWNMTKVKPLQKRGGEIRKTIETAAYVEPARVKLTTMEEVK